jgi:hypothetical protein
MAVLALSVINGATQFVYGSSQTSPIQTSQMEMATKSTKGKNFFTDIGTPFDINTSEIGSERSIAPVTTSHFISKPPLPKPQTPPPTRNFI